MCLRMFVEWCALEWASEELRWSRSTSGSASKWMSKSMSTSRNGSRRQQEEASASPQKRLALSVERAGHDRVESSRVRDRKTCERDTQTKRDETRRMERRGAKDDARCGAVRSEQHTLLLLRLHRRLERCQDRLVEHVLQACEKRTHLFAIGSSSASDLRGRQCKL